MTFGQGSELLRHRHVTIRAVIDLEHHLAADSDEMPDRMREQRHLRAPASASRGLDKLDHPGPLDHPGRLDHPEPHDRRRSDVTGDTGGSSP